ncbi:hypothetical protein HY449_00990 [Candidatus Pacearchaeota archaeon]|nr:hypothetical protein [Candidatus Pacearchaeota archaeon]
MIRREQYNINPTNLYRISPGDEPMRPQDDPGIGIEFRPPRVTYNEVTNFLNVKSMISNGVISPTAPYAGNYAQIELPEFVKMLREMIYDPENNVSLEAAVGSSERFDKIVAKAKYDDGQRRIAHLFPEEDFWDDVFTSDTAFGGDPDY